LANSDSGVMLGTSINILFPEAWRKGVRDFEEDELYSFAGDAMLREGSLSFGAPPDLAWLDEPGYYPADRVGRATAWTLEQAIADHALAKMAEERGDSADAEALLRRSESWKELYNPANGFIHGRNADGSWTVLGSESSWTEDYAEGNARQYLWLAPQDPESLFALMGGEDAALERLDELFEMMLEEDGEATGVPENWYWHGNEPGLHIPYLFALAGDMEKTRRWVSWLMENRYSTENDGLPGNDDGGTLSAWYVFSAMGLYPLAGTDRYVLGEPAFDRIGIPLGGDRMSIDRLGEGPDWDVFLDGEKWTAPDFRHRDLGSILFEGSE
jgi:predicted alpha-1,2-mannosidase